MDELYSALVRAIGDCNRRQYTEKALEVSEKAQKNNEGGHENEEETRG